MVKMVDCASMEKDINSGSRQSVCSCEMEWWSVVVKKSRIWWSIGCIMMEEMILNGGELCRLYMYGNCVDKLSYLLDGRSEHLL